jgi:Polyketide cyclase / dehydrase and lipid transport
MLKKILIAVAVVLAALVAVIATRPDTFRVQRSIAIAAPADVVFPYLNDFHRWGEFSPWDKLDPAMKRTYEGAQVGVGASYHWVGNDEVGEGRMTITESKPNEKVAIKLEFIKPFAATNLTDFTLLPAAEGVSLSWAMSGENNFMSKAFSLFMNMDSMIGKDFEAGLASLKKAAEAATAAQKPAQSTGQTTN